MSERSVMGCPERRRGRKEWYDAPAVIQRQRICTLTALSVIRLVVRSGSQITSLIVLPGFVAPGFVAAFRTGMSNGNRYR